MARRVWLFWLLSVLLTTSVGWMAHTGDIRSEGLAIDFVKQAEAGVKYRSGGLALYATGFYAETEETNFEATSRQTFDRQFKAHGIELEASYRTGGFTLSAGGTYTDAEISRDRINPAARLQQIDHRQTDRHGAGLIRHETSHH